MSGSTITSWLDKSGGIGQLPKNLTSIDGTPTVGSINGIPGVFFDGLSSIRTAVLAGHLSGVSNGITWFIVGNLTNTNTSGIGLLAGTVFSDFTTQNAISVGSSNLTLSFRKTTAGSAVLTASTPVSDSVPFLVYASTQSPVNTQYHIGTDGTKGAINTTTSFTQSSVNTLFRVGWTGSASDPKLTGTIGEIIGYSGLMTDSDRQRVEGYLAWKWNLQANLPSTHPYYFSKLKADGIKIHPLLYSGLIGSLYTWLDASDPNGTGICPASGTRIPQWVDKAGGAKTFTQSTASRYPTFTYDGQYPAISFTSSLSQFLQGSTAGAVTSFQGSIFVVFKGTNTSTNNAAFFTTKSALTAGSTTAQYTALWQFSTVVNATYYDMRYNSTTTKFGSTASTTDKRLMIVSDGTGAATAGELFFMDGVSVQTNVAGTTAAVATNNVAAIVGATCFSSTFSNFFDGFVYEVILINRSVTRTERALIEGYLAWKWGMNTSLPTNHPFYKISP
jgi:hypothetical protein